MLKLSLFRKTWLAWAALGIGSLVSVFASLQLKQAIEHHARVDFAFVCDQVTLKIQDRMDASALVLRGGRALFAASVKVERNEWQAFVGNLKAEQNIPGAQGIGFAQIIPADQLAAHIARIRGEGFSGYTVLPPGERAIYTSVIYLEPFRDLNLRAFGYDMYADPVRRAAMEQARDTGEVALSGKVRLAQETGTDIQAGILMYAPVYRNGAAVDTVEQRRAALLGWVYSPYRMDDFMAGILGDWESREGKTVDLQVYDGDEVKPGSLLFDSKRACTPDQQSLFYQQRTIGFGGRKWLLEFDRIPTAPAIAYAPAWLALAAGLVISGLLFWLIRSIINTRQDAYRIADKLTHAIRRHEEALQESEEKIRLLLDSTAEAIYGIDMDGDCTFCNNACLQLLGYQCAKELLGKNMHWQIHGKHADGTFFPLEDCLIFQAFGTGTPMHVDDEVLWRSDGTSFPAEYWSYPQIHEGVVVGAVVTFLDITERRKAEGELKQVSTRLALAARAGGIGVWDYDIVNNILLWDVRMLALNGIERMDFGDVYDAWLAGVHPDDRAREDAKIQMAIRGEKEYDTEFRVQWPDGSIRHIRALAAVQRDNSGKPERMIGTNWDITELRKAEKAKLDDSENRYRSIFRGSPDGILIADFESKMIRFANPAACQMFGYTEGQLQTMNITDLHPDDSLQDALAVFERQANGDASLSKDILCIRKNGEHFYSDINANRLVLSDRNHLAGFFRDNTERKRIQDEHDRQLAIIETYAGLVALADMDGRLIYINAGGMKMLGANQADELLTKIITDFMTPTNHRRTTDKVTPAALSDKEWNGESTLKRVDGISIPVSQTIFPILDASGNPRHIGILMMDISPQKELHEKLMISDKLAVMGRLVADVSHELNNPLAIIIGRTEFILNRIDTESTRFQAQLEIILRSALRCKTILSNLLTYSRTISKKESAVNLLDLFDEAINAVNYECDLTGIEVAMNCDLPAGSVISGNKDALLSVFINLIRNARRAMAGKGTLTFTIAMENDSRVRIEVNDSGIGISKEKLQNIFQPFRSGWKEGDGTGLGLTTSFGIIDAHGGEMWVESEGEGKGTTFIVLLPHFGQTRVTDVNQTIGQLGNET